MHVFKYLYKTHFFIEKEGPRGEGTEEVERAAGS